MKWINLFLCKTVDFLPRIFWQNTSCVWKACVSWLFNVNFIPFEMSSIQTEVCTRVPVWILEDTFCIYDEIPKQVRNESILSSILLTQNRCAKRKTFKFSKLATLCAVVLWQFNYTIRILQIVDWRLQVLITLLQLRLVFGFLVPNYVMFQHLCLTY